MPVKKEWRESSNGPDALDCGTMMAALQALHSAHVAVIVSPAGIGSPTGVDIAASALFETLPGSALNGGVGVHANWPNREGQTFWGCVYGLLFKLDVEIGKVYQNETLWK